jgi:hypothetical protein
MINKALHPPYSLDGAVFDFFRFGNIWFYSFWFGGFGDATVPWDASPRDQKCSMNSKERTAWESLYERTLLQMGDWEGSDTINLQTIGSF